MPETRAGRNRDDYRKKNRGIALRLIATQTCTTRSGLAEKLGLSKMAITKIVSEMIGRGLLCEDTIRSEESGRTPIRLRISDSAPLVAGVAIQRDRCEAVICDLNLRVLQREKIYYGKDMGEEKLLTYIYQALDTLLFGRDNVIAIGASCVGPVSSSAGMILNPFYFYGIHDVEIVRLLSERYNLPAYLDHDNQSAAMAEFYYGCGKGIRDILYIGVGTGVGCGIIQDGMRYRNDRGLPPEMGHVSVNINGPRCECGSRGCVEAYIRTPVIMEELFSRTGKYYSYETFSRLQDNEAVRQVFEDSVRFLACAAVSTVNIMNSEMIILGNDAVYWDDRYIRMLEELVNEKRFVEWDAPIKVCRSGFAEDALVLGAACNAIEKLFGGALLFEENEMASPR